MSATDNVMANALVDEAQDTVHSIVHHAQAEGIRLPVTMVTCYTTGFEAGLALGLREPQAGQRLLDAIDAAILDGSAEAIVTERQKYISRYVALTRRMMT